jgi:hypothetical protein
VLQILTPYEKKPLALRDKIVWVQRMLHSNCQARPALAKVDCYATTRTGDLAELIGVDESSAVLGLVFYM